MPTTAKASFSVPDEVRNRGPVLVTGAGGFLGSNVVRALRGHGLPVRALVRRPPRGPQWRDLDGVEFVFGDICQPDQVASAMKGVGHVIHGAALVDLAPRPRRRAFQVNLEGTRVVCAAALRAGVRRLVFTSSVGTLPPGTAAKPTTESNAGNRPGLASAYHVSKRRAEEVVREFAGRGLETIILCPGLIVGPYDASPKSNLLVLGTARFPQAMLPGGGINMIDVRETALAHVRALWLGQPGMRYLVAGPYRTYSELGNTVRRIVGYTAAVPTLPRWAELPGSLVLAILSALLPRVPNELSLPNYRFGFLSLHASGELADRTFGLVHRPLSVTVWDTLRWFQDKGLAPWLKRSLTRPEEAVEGK